MFLFLHVKSFTTIAHSNWHAFRVYMAFTPEPHWHDSSI